VSARRSLKSKDFIIFGKPDIGEAEIKAVTDVLKSGWLSTGPVVSEFEKEFEDKFGGYAVALASCTQALMAALTVSNVGAGAEVIVPPITFCATVNAILAVGAKPVFVDVTASGHLNPDLIQHVVTPKTKAIIPVHYLGAPANMDRIIDEARKHGLKVIEDAAHAFGGDYQPKGDFACYSFYPTKNITSAEGGMVVCQDPGKAARIKIWASQGLSMGAWKRYGRSGPAGYEVEFPGHKGNMSDVHAAIGLTQFKRWPEIKAKRDKVWAVYEKAWGEKEAGHSRHLFTIKVNGRDELRRLLKDAGIGTGVHFNPLHLEPAYRFLRYQAGSFPKSEWIGSHTISLPVSATMTVKDAQRVVDEVVKHAHS